MAFGFGKKNKGKPAKKSQREVAEVDDEDEEEVDLVMFQGATNGEEANLAANGKLMQVGLVPAKHLITKALNQRAEMVRLEPRGKAAAARFYVDGIPYSGGKMPGQQAKAITQMLKLLAGLDIKERSSKQSGGINAEFGDNKFLLTVESSPTKEGPERLLVRIKDTKVSLSTPE